MKFEKLFNILLSITTTLLISSSLAAEMSDEDKILVLTEYLVNKEGRDTISARNEAIATIYGKPKFKNLVYDDASEMFFAQVVSQNGSFSRDVNFFMPRKRALAFKKDLEAGKIEVEHAFDDNEIVIKGIELSYNNVEYPLNIKESTSITLKAGAYFVIRQDTEVQAQKSGIGGIINLQDALGMQTTNQAMRLEASYKFNDKHKVAFSYHSLSNSNTAINNQPIEYNGEIIDAGSTINVHFDTDIYKVNYIYSAYQTNKLNFSFRVGLHTTGVSTGLDTTVKINEEETSLTNEAVSLTAPLPVLGIGLSYNIISNVSINYEIDYFFISYEDISGNMVDTMLALEYQYNRYLGLGIGINSTNMFFKAKTKDTDFQLRNNVSGILTYLTFSY